MTKTLTLLTATTSNPFNYTAQAYRDLATRKIYTTIQKDDGFALTTAECDDVASAREFIKSWSFDDAAIIDAIDVSEDGPDTGNYDENYSDLGSPYSF